MVSCGWEVQARGAKEIRMPLDIAHVKPGYYFSALLPVPVKQKILF